MNLIEICIPVASKSNVTRWSLATAHPLDSSWCRPRSDALITSRSEDSYIQPLPIDVGIDAIGSVPVVLVPTVNLIEVKLNNNRDGIGRDGIRLLRSRVVLDEPTKELRESHIEIDLAVSPTSKRPVLEVFRVNDLFRYTPSTVGDGSELEIIETAALIEEGYRCYSSIQGESELTVGKEAVGDDQFVVMDLILVGVVGLTEADVSRGALTLTLPTDSSWRGIGAVTLIAPIVEDS